MDTDDFTGGERDDTNIMPIPAATTSDG